MSHLPLGEEGLDLGPSFALSSILESVRGKGTRYREQVHDNCSLLDCFLDLEEVLPGNPAIFHSLFP